MKIEVTDGNTGMSVLTSHAHQMTKSVQTRRGTSWGWLCRFYVSPFCIRGIDNKIFKPLICSSLRHTRHTGEQRPALSTVLSMTPLLFHVAILYAADVRILMLSWTGAKWTGLPGGSTARIERCYSWRPVCRCGRNVSISTKWCRALIK